MFKVLIDQASVRGNHALGLSVETGVLTNIRRFAGLELNDAVIKQAGPVGRPASGIRTGS